ncbi:MAG TPA: Gfo/Idh/MocA family oxidoreductase [Burkholderiales bacterium]|nr:Gfo/Idh/MocA family oxidoreductase [Burkholderiales bacterium]
MKTLRAAVIGTGYLGALHAAKYSACRGVKLVGAADLVAARAARVARAHGCRAVRDFRELLREVDLVSVAVPTRAHYAVARECLAAGVHVLLEKPIARTLHEADALIALARSRGVCLGVDHLERFNPAFATLAARVGRPLFIEAERLSHFKQRGTDVDVVLDLMIHDIDLVLALVGSEVASLSACGFRVLTDSPDIADARIEFADGRVASLSASRVSQIPVRKLRAFGRARYGSADLQNARLRLVRRGRGAAIVEEERAFSRADALGASIRAFVAAVRRGRTPPVSGQDGRRALALALEVRRQIGERVARLSRTARGKGR